MALDDTRAAAIPTERSLFITCLASQLEQELFDELFREAVFLTQSPQKMVEQISPACWVISGAARKAANPNRSPRVRTRDIAVLFARGDRASGNRDPGNRPTGGAASIAARLASKTIRSLSAEVVRSKSAWDEDLRVLLKEIIDLRQEDRTTIDALARAIDL